jgi:hypothetical protein
MKPPGRDRIKILRHEGEKSLIDAIMIPDTLLTLQVAARAAESLPWLLTGSQAASCYMESRATVEIEVLVPASKERSLVEGRVGPLPEGHKVIVRTAEEAGVTIESLTMWSRRARRDELEGATVLIPQAADLFLLMLAESRVIQSPMAMYFAARLLQLHGPFALAEVELSEYQEERLREAAALVLRDVAERLEGHLARIGAT